MSLQHQDRMYDGAGVRGPQLMDALEDCPMPKRICWSSRAPVRLLTSAMNTSSPRDHPASNSGAPESYVHANVSGACLSQFQARCGTPLEQLREAVCVHDAHVPPPAALGLGVHERTAVGATVVGHDVAGQIPVDNKGDLPREVGLGDRSVLSGSLGAVRSDRPRALDENTASKADRLALQPVNCSSAGSARHRCLSLSRRPATASRCAAARARSGSRRTRRPVSRHPRREKIKRVGGASRAPGRPGPQVADPVGRTPLPT